MPSLNSDVSISLAPYFLSLQRIFGQLVSSELRKLLRGNEFVLQERSEHLLKLEVVAFHIFKIFLNFVKHSPGMLISNLSFFQL